jgi:hypothetical protein
MLRRRKRSTDCVVDAIHRDVEFRPSRSALSWRFTSSEIACAKAPFSILPSLLCVPICIHRHAIGRDYAAPLQLETSEFALSSGWGVQK